MTNLVDTIIQEKRGVIYSDFIKQYSLLDKTLFKSECWRNNIKIPEEEIGYYFCSGGTSGSPKVIPVTLDEWNIRNEYRASCYKQVGISDLSRAWIAMPFGPWAAGPSVHESLQKINCTILPAGLENDQSILNYVWEQVNKMNIDTLFSTPSLAEFILYTLKLDSWGPIKTIITTGESVSQSFTQFMKKNGAKVIASYGTSEYFIGISTDHNPVYYFDPKYVFVEVLDESGRPTTEEGYIYITAWESSAIPLMRYPLGDKGKVEYFLEKSEVKGKILWSGREQKSYELAGAVNFTRENISEFVTSLNNNISECKIVLNNMKPGVDQISISLTFSNKNDYVLFDPDSIRNKFSKLSIDIDDAIYQGFVEVKTEATYNGRDITSKRKIDIQDHRDYQR